MRRIRLFFWRVWASLRADRLDGDLQRQIASHLDEAAEEYVRHGLSGEEARRRARRDLGNLGRIEEAWRDTRAFPLLGHVRRDLRHGARSLRRNPAFAGVVVMVLAIGIGAATAVFALLNNIVLQPLPYDDSDHLVTVGHSAPARGLEHAGLSSGLYFHYAEHTETLESLAVYLELAMLNLRLPDEGTERVRVAFASAGLFRVLRTRPALGRLFTEEDGRPGFMNMRWTIPVLLSHSFWIGRFGGDPNVIGRILALNDSPREVVGVLPEGFAFPHADTQIWMLLEPARPLGDVTRNLSWAALARMQPGMTAASVEAELTQLLNGLSTTSGGPDVTPELRLRPIVTPLKSVVIRDVAHVIWLLFGGIAILLLVACANAGGLFLIRAEHRSQEIAVRRALGAHGPHLGSLFLTEALLLACTAAAIGLLIAHGIVTAVAAFAHIDLPRISEVRLDPLTILFAAAAAVSMALCCAALSGSARCQPLTSSSHQRSTRRRAHLRGPDALIVLQMALALTLMSASALMVATYHNLSRRDLGFSPDDVLTVEIGLPTRKAPQHATIYRDVVDEIRRLPHVDHAGAASFVPLIAASHVFPLEAGATPVPFKFFVPGYFETMGTAVLEGERLAAGERVSTHRPVLVSAALAKRLFPGERAVGRTLRRLNEDGSRVELLDGEMPPFTIAGITADVRESDLRESPTEIVYVPVIDPPVEQSIVPTTMRVVARTRQASPELITTLRQAVARVDPDLSVGRIQNMSAIVVQARAREGFIGMLLLMAAAVSLLMGAVGVYGSVAQVVQRRKREIGVRMALGATHAEIVRMVVTGSMRAVLMGGALGLVLSLMTSRMLDSLLFGVTADDPNVYALVTAGLLITAGTAALLAGRRAARVEPLVALRAD